MQAIKLKPILFVLKSFEIDTELRSELYNANIDYITVPEDMKTWSETMKSYIELYDVFHDLRKHSRVLAFNDTEHYTDLNEIKRKVHELHDVR